MDRCSTCPRKFNYVPPNGPIPCDILFIGEAPGKDEDREKVPFVGKTGREVNEHYLPLAGLSRRTVRFTNAIKCYPDRPKGRLDINREADADLLECCASNFIPAEIEEAKPHLIVPMGTLACHVIDPDINLEHQHGIPLETSFGTVFPMYHPAGGLHEPKKMLLIRNDWYRLGKYLKGKLTIPVDEYLEPKYNQINKSGVLELFSKCNDYTQPIALDTEVTRFREPYCLTFSLEAGTGNLIPSNDKETLAALDSYIQRWEGPILWHNYIGIDYRACIDMGLHMPWNKIVDTMTMAFHLGNLPQGLKALSYRLLGMQMQDFDDVVTPYSVPLCLEYLEQVRAMDWSKPEEQLVRDENGDWKLYKPQSVSTKIKRFFTDYTKNPALDLFERWGKWEDAHQMIEEKCGLFPGKDIRYAPPEKALHYACRDSDALLRVYPVLKAMKQRVRKTAQENW